jgi:fucose permease
VSARFWALAPSIFWGGVLFGRAITPALLKQLTPRAIVLAGLVIAAAGAFTLVFIEAPGLTLPAGALCGIGLAPIYPLVVAQYAASQPGDGSTGLVFAAGGLGGAAGPLATGYISQLTGSLRNGLACSLPAIALMTWLQLRLAPRSGTGHHKSLEMQG